MNAEITNIPENRALTETESNFIRWLLEHGDERARSFLPQLDDAWVTERCSCGCASINLSINGVTYYGKTGMETLGDYCWHSSSGAFFGVFAFACNDLLAGIDLYSLDGQSTASEIPDVSLLTVLE